MVGNFEFGYQESDVRLLTEITRVSAIAKCPFIAGVSPTVFGNSPGSFGQFPRAAEMDQLFRQPHYGEWNAFRDLPEARYVGLAMPRFLLRKPYTVEDMDVRDFRFEEEVRIETLQRCCWRNAAFALAARMIQSFANYGWCTAIAGPVQGLPHIYRDPQPYPLSWQAVEALMAPEEQDALVRSGLIPLVMRREHDSGYPDGAFFDAPSVKRVAEFANAPEAKKHEERARLGASLPYLMILCRIAQYVRLTWRENVARFPDADLSTLRHGCTSPCGHRRKAVPARRPPRGGLRW